MMIRIVSMMGYGYMLCKGRIMYAITEVITETAHEATKVASRIVENMDGLFIGIICALIVSIISFMISYITIKYTTNMSGFHYISTERIKWIDNYKRLYVDYSSFLLLHSDGRAVSDSEWECFIRTREEMKINLSGRKRAGNSDSEGNGNGAQDGKVRGNNSSPEQLKYPIDTELLDLLDKVERDAADGKLICHSEKQKCSSDTQDSQECNDNKKCIMDNCEKVFAHVQVITKGEWDKVKEESGDKGKIRAINKIQARTNKKTVVR